MLGHGGLGLPHLGAIPSGGPQTYSVSVTEAASATDAVSSLAVFPSSISEAASAADTESSAAIFPSSTTEAASAADSDSSAAIFASFITETGAANDSGSAVGAFGVALVEAASATDALSAIATYPSAIIEAASAIDVLSAIQAHPYPNRPGNQINYFYKFASEVIARNDPVVGPSLNAQTGLFPLTVYNIRANSVTALDGYWCAITGNYPVSVPLAEHPKTQFVLDRQLEFVAGQSGGLFT